MVNKLSKGIAYCRNFVKICFNHLSTQKLDSIRRYLKMQTFIMAITLLSFSFTE